MDKEIRRNQPSSRFFAFGAIVFSTVSITGCLLVFPLIFHYLQTLEASVQVDLNFCNVIDETNPIIRLLLLINRVIF